MKSPVFTCALAGLALLAAGAVTTAPGSNWVLPLFSDKEGYRSMTARGSEVRPAGGGAFTVSNLNVTIFSGDAAARVETVLLSSLATFFPQEKRASGSNSVRIIRDDLEATGLRWSYVQDQKHVTLEGDVQIIFNAPLPDILK